MGVCGSNFSMCVLVEQTLFCNMAVRNRMVKLSCKTIGIFSSQNNLFVIVIFNLPESYPLIFIFLCGWILKGAIFSTLTEISGHG